jgi:hypothetical protein
VDDEKMIDLCTTSTDYDTFTILTPKSLPCYSLVGMKNSLLFQMSIVPNNLLVRRLVDTHLFLARFPSAGFHFGKVLVIIWLSLASIHATCMMRLNIKLGGN